MASSGSVGCWFTGYDYLELRWTAQRHYGDNTSRIFWELVLTATDYGRIDANPGAEYRVELDGQVFTGTDCLAIGNNETKILASGQAVVPHGPDGTKTMALSFQQAVHITFAGSYIPSASASGEAELESIVRATVPVLPESGVLGTPIPITLEAPAGFTHTLTWVFGSRGGSVAEDAAGEAVWTPPVDLAQEIPNALAGTARILCRTFLDGMPLGEIQEAAVLLRVPEEVCPQAAEISLTDATGAWERFGNPVQLASQLVLEFDALGAYGSAVTATRLTLDGENWAGGVPRRSGEQLLRLELTDSRGRVGVWEQTLNVLPYHPPKLVLTAHRCDEAGNATDTGGFFQARAVVELAELGGNSGILSFPGQAEIAVESGVSEHVFFGEAPTDTAVYLTAQVTDVLATTGANQALSPAYATLDLLAGGRGIAFGTTATREGFHCAMDAVFTGAVEMGEIAAGAIRMPDGRLLSEYNLEAIGTALDQINGEVV